MTTELETKLGEPIWNWVKQYAASSQLTQAVVVAPIALLLKSFAHLLF